MKRLTVEEVDKIEAINGTLSDRYEYMEAITEILDADHASVRWVFNRMKTVRLPADHLLDITTKTVKGKRYIVVMWIYNKQGRLELTLQRKKGVWCNFFDRDWFTPDGQYKDGAQALKDQPYLG